MSKRVTERAADGHAYLKAEQGRLLNVRTQNVDAIYGLNRTLRHNIAKEAVTRKGSWALPIGNIPMVQYQNMLRANPELRSKDAEVRTKAWMKALRQTSAENDRCVSRNLIPDSPTPDRGSIILPTRVQKQIHQEATNGR